MICTATCDWYLCVNKSSFIGRHKMASKTAKLKKELDYFYSNLHSTKSSNSPSIDLFSFSDEQQNNYHDNKDNYPNSQPQLQSQLSKTLFVRLGRVYEVDCFVWEFLVRIEMEQLQKNTFFKNLIYHSTFSKLSAIILGQYWQKYHL